MRFKKAAAIAICLMLCAAPLSAPRADAKYRTKKEPAITMELIDSMIDSVAIQLIGTPYSLGAKGPGAFDCSTFITYIFKYMGVKSVSGTSRELASNTKWSAINDISEIMRGDLLFFSSPDAPARVSHVALYLGEGLFIHCSVSSDGVAIQDFCAYYYYKYFVGARRLVKEVPSGMEMGIPADMLKVIDEIGNAMSASGADYRTVTVPVTELGSDWAVVFEDNGSTGNMAYIVDHTIEGNQ